jgi:chromosome segregation ATPase
MRSNEEIQAKNQQLQHQMETLTSANNRLTMDKEELDNKIKDMERQSKPLEALAAYNDRLIYEKEEYDMKIKEMEEQLKKLEEEKAKLLETNAAAEAQCRQLQIEKDQLKNNLQENEKSLLEEYQIKLKALEDEKDHTITTLKGQLTAQEEDINKLKQNQAKYLL